MSKLMIAKQIKKNNKKTLAKDQKLTQVKTNYILLKKKS